MKYHFYRIAKKDRFVYSREHKNDHEAIQRGLDSADVWGFRLDLILDSDSRTVWEHEDGLLLE